MRTVSNPSQLHSEWHEELCALAAIGELSSSEYEELQRHLAECGDCRELYADFRRLTAEDLGLVAVQKRAEQTEEAAAALDEKELLSRLLDRATRERENQNSAEAPSSLAQKRSMRDRFAGLVFWLRRPALSYGSLALILCATAAIGAYRLREAQLAPMLEGLNSQVRDWKGRAATSEAQQKSASELLQQAQSERKALQGSLSVAQAKYLELQAERANLESQLAAAHARLDQEGQKVDTAMSSAADKDKQVAQLEVRLRNAILRSAEQEQIADSLRNRLQLSEQVAAQAAASAPESQGFGDAEAKELFGARDLHIVDVYDVDSSGKTRRTYGRVFYAEKKLLIFYAFDLEGKKRNRAAAGFQAWGYRQPNSSQPENLGLFQVDDASANRWVLKVNNPRVLERIDAVFVTLESPDGSPVPRGRRLLYANLAGPANHP